jgi:integrase
MPKPKPAPQPAAGEPKQPKRANGTGTIFQRANGSWTAQAFTPDRKRRSATFPTWKQASDWLSEVRTDVRRGEWRPPEPADETVPDYVRRWIKEHPRLKASTAAEYRGVLERHIEPHLERVTLAELTPATVRAWHARVGGLTGPAATANAYQLLRAACATAVEDDVLKANPCRVRGASRAPAPTDRRVVTPGEVARIADAVHPRYRALVLVLAWGGLRSGEAFALRPENVHGNRIHVVERRYRHADGTVSTDAPKSAAGVRWVTLPETVAAELKAHLEAYPGPLVFTTTAGNPFSSGTLGDVLRRAAARAGVPRFRPHDLRSTAGTVATQNGATVREVMAQLGHTTADVALLYQRATEERAVALAAAADDVIRSGSNVVPLRKRSA